MENQQTDELTGGIDPEFDTPPLRLEHKAFLPADPSDDVPPPATEDLMGDLARRLTDHQLAFEDFKQVNDQRLRELKSRSGPDPLTEEKLTRIEAQLDRYALERARPSRQLLDALADEPDERKAALETYIRKGRTDDLVRMETRGMSVGSEADGGYLVHPQMDSELHTALKDESPMRRLSTSLTISTSGYKRPFAISGAGSGWVAETAARPTTMSPQIAELAFPAMELYAMPVATKQLLEDTIIDIDGWLVGELSASFGEQETAAFITGDGIAMPEGILSYAQQPVESATWGQVGTIATGANGDFAADDPADSLIELVHSLPAKYRRNGTFLMNRMTLSAVRRLKSAGGDYLFQADLADGFRMTLLGFPVVECDDMPDMDPASPAIAFGDFKRAYLIVDRQGVQVLRDPYSAKPYVLFYATKRVGGGIADFNALRLLTFSAG